MNEVMAQADMIRLLETQLQNLGQAENHPRWTNTGEIVLIGDMGMLGDPEGKNRIERRIVGIDGIKAEVWVQPIDATWSAVTWNLPFGQCAELTGRSRLPRNL